MKKIVATLCVVMAALPLVSVHAQQQDAVRVIEMNVAEVAAGHRAVVGVAVNQSTTVVKNAFLTFKVYDANGMVLGNAVAHASNIEPGEQWRFQAPSPYRFETAKIAEIRVFNN